MTESVSLTLALVTTAAEAHHRYYLIKPRETTFRSFAAADRRLGLFTHREGALLLGRSGFGGGLLGATLFGAGAEVCLRGRHERFRDPCLVFVDSGVERCDGAFETGTL